MSYRQVIISRIKDEVNRWIEQLKGTHPELLLTKQWQVRFPKGFKAGFNTLPVVTPGKRGPRRVAQVEFVLPENLELEEEDLKLILKDESFSEPKPATAGAAPVSLDEPLTLMNTVVGAVNRFLIDLHLPGSGPSGAALNLIESEAAPGKTPAAPADPRFPPEARAGEKRSDEPQIHEVRSALLKSDRLPEWLKTIESREIFEGLIDQLAAGFIEYRERHGTGIKLRDFLKQYEERLKENHRLYAYCKYQGKPIKEDEHGWCLENYCRKKPAYTACPNATWKFGVPD